MNALAIAVLLLAAEPAPTPVSTLPIHFYAGGGGGWVDPRGGYYDNQIRPGFGYEIVGGIRVLPQIALEGTYFLAQAEYKGSTLGKVTIDEPCLGVRLFPLGDAPVQPTISVSYSDRVTGKAKYESGGEAASLDGYTTVLAGGLRSEPVKYAWASLDVRYSWVRWTDGQFFIFSGLPRQEHGDEISILATAGLRY